MNTALAQVHKAVNAALTFTRKRGYMQTILKKVAPWLLLACSIGYGQLHLITGSSPLAATDGYPFTIYSVSEGTQPKPILTFLSGKNATDWIGYSHGWGLLVAVTRDPGSRIFTLALRAGFAEKQCAEPPPKNGGYPVYRWLIDVPDVGPTLTEFFSAGNPPLGYLRGMSLDASVPCEKSFFDVDIMDLKRLEANGHAGVDTILPSDGMALVGIDSEGRLREWLPGAGSTYFDYQVPKEMFAGFAHPTAAIAINNKTILALQLGDDGKPSSFRLLAYSKSDSSWSRLPAAIGDPGWCCRGFGPYITVVEAHTKEGGNKESAGSEGWRPASARTGPSMKGVFDRSRDVYPGRLHIYDARNGQLYTIDTKQGDSEVLLIEDGTVYYRISDQLYSAVITENGIGSGRLLAASDIIRDVHWAFVKR
jgi:hypothetical protein